MRVVVLVPRREGKPDRDLLWAYVRDRWQTWHPEWGVFEGHHDTGLFNRAAAINRAAGYADWEQAEPWDVAVIIDADVLLDPDRCREGVALALETGRMVLPFNVRYDLNQRGTDKIIRDDYRGSWKPYVHRTYTEMVSGVVIVTRQLWDAVGGFDESFVGWGFEDNAFASACQTFAGQAERKMPGELWHLYHATASEGKRGTPSLEANRRRADLYLRARGDPDAIRALRATAAPSFEHNQAGIPRILHRVVPEVTTPEAERYWTGWQSLHPGWTFLTHRDPLVPAEWPETAAFWHHAANGAQLADMVRLEALWRWGGIYVDQDVEGYRSLEPLLPLSAFAAWEDPQAVPNAVLGAVAGHPAIRACLDLMLSRLPGDTWQAGPGVTTKILPGRDDVLLLPPGSFYPYHYREKHRATENHRRAQPWAFGAHHWWGSWLEKKAG